LTRKWGEITAAGFFSPATFFANFKEPECPAVDVNIPASNPRLIAALNWGPRQRSRHHEKVISREEPGGEEYLTIEVGSRGFVVALDVFLDCLAR